MSQYSVKNSFSSQVNPIHVDLEFKNLGYYLEKSKQKILKDVSGGFQSKSLTALLGVSGAGKSTLLNVLSSRITKNVTGDILLNGRSSTSLSKSITGYVTQQDIFLSELTVLETLRYSALLKLGKKMSFSGKMKRVDDVINIVGLNKCRDSRVGSSFRRGISGGELKRLNVACELLSNPPLFLLDEPTSGLDSAVSYSLVRVLRDIAHKTNRTVICSIHQPSNRVFFTFDKVVCIVEGHIVYQGSVSRCVEYFSKLGFVCPETENFPDMLIDIFSDVEKNEYLIQSYHKNIWRCKDGSYDMKIPIEIPGNSIAIKDELSSEKINSDQDTKELDRLDIIKSVKSDSCDNLINKDLEGQELSEPLDDLIVKHYDKPSYIEQTRTLLRRNFRSDCKSLITGVEFLEIIFVAIISGALWFKTIPDYTYDKLNDRIGLLMFTSSFWAFFPAFQSLYSFPSERVVLAKERSSKMYKVSSYLIARSISEMVIGCILPTIWLIIVYPMAGFPATANSIFGVWFSLILSVVVSQSMGMLISCLCYSIKSATSSLSVVLLCSMLCGGFYVKQENIPGWISWLRYISLMNYTATILLRVNLSGKTLECPFGSNIPPAGYHTCPIPGEDVIGNITTNFSIVANVFILLGLYVFFKLTAYLVLRFSRAMKM